MVLLKMRCDPKDRKATIAVRFETSPGIRLSPGPSESALSLRMHLKAVDSTQPSRPITICVSDTIFSQESSPDILARGAFGAGLISTSDDSRTISLGYLMIRKARDESDDSPNLSDRGMKFITIPSDGKEVPVTHNLSLERLLERSDSVKKGDLRTGETFKINMNDGFVGTMWWCWGDLNGDLKNQKLHAWQKGINLSDCNKPSQGEIDEQGWVLGEDPAELIFEDRSGWVEVPVTE